MTIVRREGENGIPPSDSSTKETPSSGSDLDSILDLFVTQLPSIYPLEIFENEIPSIRAAAHRALAVADSKVILDGAMRYHAECSGREARFIADPVNWLNGRKWIGKGKIRANAVILRADGSSISASHQGTMRDRIQNWEPARRTMTAINLKTEEE